MLMSSICQRPLHLLYAHSRISLCSGRGQGQVYANYPAAYSRRTESEQPQGAPFYQFVGCREDTAFLILQGPGEVLKSIYY